jgi:hypothetical protein
MTVSRSDFLLDDKVRIVVPLHPSSEDLFLVKSKGTTGFRGGSSELVNEYCPIIPETGIILKAIDAVKARN